MSRSHPAPQQLRTSARREVKTGFGYKVGMTLAYLAGVKLSGPPPGPPPAGTPPLPPAPPPALQQLPSQPGTHFAPGIGSYDGA
jgi:hypothetical protein